MLTKSLKARVQVPAFCPKAQGPDTIRFVLLVALLASTLLGRAEDGVVRLAAVGDVMLSRGVPPVIAAHGVAWPWEHLAPTLGDADLRFCNLECPVTTGGMAIPKENSFRADPAVAGGVLGAGGINVVSLANNHTYDYGRPGLADTLDAMAALGITAPGAGSTRVAAHAPRIVTCNRLKVAFLAYTAWMPEEYIPSETETSLAVLDENTLVDEVKAAKAQADCLVVSFHWGVEYLPVSTDDQQRVAHAAIDAGADVILGSHPHVAQPVEIYHNRPIFYSLGNCIFDRTGDKVSNGLLAHVKLSRNGASVEKVLAFDIEEVRPGAVNDEEVPKEGP